MWVRIPSVAYMKILISINDDDYVAVNIANRIQVLETLKTCLDGDLWANRDDEEKYPDDLDITLLSYSEYEEFLDEITSNSMYCQIVNLIE